MYFKQLLRKIPHSKLVKRSTLVLLSLFPIALALTVVADRPETTRTDTPDGSAFIANSSFTTAPGQEAAPSFSSASEDQTYLPELRAYSEGSPSIHADNGGATAAFAFDGASNTAESTVRFENNLSLSEFLQAKVHPASTLYGGAHNAYGSTIGGAGFHAGNFGAGGMPDSNAGSGVKTHDLITPVGDTDIPLIVDIPNTTGLEGPSQPISVPEPETWALLAIGLIGCFLSRRRAARTV